MTYFLNCLGGTPFSNISSISAGVRRAVSGMMNQPMATTTAPIQPKNRPVLTPQPTLPLMKIGVMNENCLVSREAFVKCHQLTMIEKMFGIARPHPAEIALKSCLGISDR